MQIVFFGKEIIAYSIADIHFLLCQKCMFFYALFVTCPPKKFIHLIVTCYLTPAVWTHFF